MLLFVLVPPLAPTRTPLDQEANRLVVSPSTIAFPRSMPLQHSWVLQPSSTQTLLPRSPSVAIRSDLLRRCVRACVRARAVQSVQQSSGPRRCPSQVSSLKSQAETAPGRVERLRLLLGVFVRAYLVGCRGLLRVFTLLCVFTRESRALKRCGWKMETGSLVGRRTGFGSLVGRHTGVGGQDGRPHGVGRAHRNGQVQTPGPWSEHDCGGKYGSSQQPDPLPGPEQPGGSDGPHCPGKHWKGH